MFGSDGTRRGAERTSQLAPSGVGGAQYLVVYASRSAADDWDIIAAAR